MSVTTKDRLEFTHAMARHTKATVRQCEALMRYASTLQRLAEDDCNVATDEAGQKRRDAKKLRIANKVLTLCGEIMGASNREAPCSCGTAKKEHGRLNHPFTPIPLVEDPCLPIFSSDPRGAVLKIRVPDGFTNDMGKEGICVPS